jgi:hypothetical protein
MPDPADREGDGEVRHLPVLASESEPEALASEPRPLEPLRVALPAPLIAAAGGFVLGVATYLAIRALRAATSPARVLARRRRKRAKGLDIAASRSFLVDVHLLKR